jgi:hypothetical protein
VFAGTTIRLTRIQRRMSSIALSAASQPSSRDAVTQLTPRSYARALRLEPKR